MNAGRRRAAPMAPADRRAAIVQATVPLLRTRGWLVTTKEIAAAAQVAEGTIFSVFDDKTELLVAALEAGLDPEPTARAVSRIDARLPLERRVEAALEILQRWMTETWELAGLFKHEEVRKRPMAQRHTADLFVRAVATQLESSRDELQVAPATAAQTLVALAIAGSNPMFFAYPLNRADTVKVMLDGIRRPVRSMPPSAVPMPVPGRQPCPVGDEQDPSAVRRPIAADQFGTTQISL